MRRLFWIALSLYALTLTSIHASPSAAPATTGCQPEGSYTVVQGKEFSTLAIQQTPSGPRLLFQALSPAGDTRSWCFVPGKFATPERSPAGSSALEVQGQKGEFLFLDVNRALRNLYCQNPSFLATAPQAIQFVLNFEPQSTEHRACIEKIPPFISRLKPAARDKSFAVLHHGTHHRPWLAHALARAGSIPELLNISDLRPLRGKPGETPKPADTLVAGHGGVYLRKPGTTRGARVFYDAETHSFITTRGDTLGQNQADHLARELCNDLAAATAEKSIVEFLVDHSDRECVKKIAHYAFDPNSSRRPGYSSSSVDDIYLSTRSLQQLLAAKTGEKKKLIDEVVAETGREIITVNDRKYYYVVEPSKIAGSPLRYRRGDLRGIAYICRNGKCTDLDKAQFAKEPDLFLTHDQELYEVYQSTSDTELAAARWASLQALLAQGRMTEIATLVRRAPDKQALESQVRYYLIPRNQRQAWHRLMTETSDSGSALVHAPSSPRETGEPPTRPELGHI